MLSPTPDTLQLSLALLDDVLPSNKDSIPHHSVPITQTQATSLEQTEKMDFTKLRGKCFRQGLLIRGHKQALAVRPVVADAGLSPQFEARTNSLQEKKLPDLGAELEDQSLALNGGNTRLITRLLKYEEGQEEVA